MKSTLINYKIDLRYNFVITNRATAFLLQKKIGVLKLEINYELKEVLFDDKINTFT